MGADGLANASASIARKAIDKSVNTCPDEEALWCVCVCDWLDGGVLTEQRPRGGRENTVFDVCATRCSCCLRTSAGTHRVSVGIYSVGGLPPAILETELGVRSEVRTTAIRCGRAVARQEVVGVEVQESAWHPSNRALQGRAPLRTALVRGAAGQGCGRCAALFSSIQESPARRSRGPPFPVPVGPRSPRRDSGTRPTWPAVA